ncbi:hypothetical protein HRR83_003504 [Exophiala dermatitidis]|uniref:PIN domain-containing protein n=2 Tax=Exophiala dermatitidis TaxID=5970 RepID=H6BLU5_EXODN|nr:uncharacterized protein HMPREF1120_00157 [Exophiala dermatitidis NIH/UT8656]KAJ4514607.1 hypothetical protein HRR75_003971 [Exophiala dermatitidis]EHY51934.1 hypothetical protein HMPREF1120_00157 [Exophiala dermatitidis NIH/UT8656]KAJ4518039.1 hypothetical protein HRR74_004334 [Exophiala dermatitidis]KAJ4520938.1 hypothetical protein HRR73_003279 [Exophiala dermatitidis]KAJ4546043.1 hypothetical protein HRR78_005882 [Exophiala dermatitidis]
MTRSSGPNAMSSQNIIRCLVDDTALTRNTGEIENWVSQGKIILVVPLYTIERLHLLKKDSSSIGANARKAVKFLDRFTSSRGDLRHDPVILQGPDEQYATWAEVEARYTNENLKTAGTTEEETSLSGMDKKQEKDAELPLKGSTGAAGTLSQMLLDRLNFTKDPAATSPTSTPPLSPASSGPQSSKTSPEVKSAVMVAHDQTPVPPSLKPLLNSVVWYVHEKTLPADQDVLFLTNSPDTMHLARDFGVPTKNIHQLRSALGVEEPEFKVQENPKKEVITKRGSRSEQKTLFSYEDEDSDAEEVVFKPRGRGVTRGAPSSRGSAAGSLRGDKGGHGRSPRLSFSQSAQPAPNKPQIPIEEIDPDSFDRGSFGRGSTPLVNTGTYGPSQFNHGRGSGYRGNHGPGGRGANHTRGSGRGGERGSARGRGRLFVP